MTEQLRCSRCELSDETVKRADNGIPRHETPMKCIGALKAALVDLRVLAKLDYTGERKQ